MKHGRVTVEEPQEDGTVKIVTKGYFEELNSIKEEVRQNLNTTRATLGLDIIKALDVFTTTDSPEITFTIKKRNGDPVQIIRTHVLYKEKK